MCLRRASRSGTEGLQLSQRSGALYPLLPYASSLTVLVDVGILEYEGRIDCWVWYSSFLWS